MSRIYSQRKAKYTQHSGTLPIPPIIGGFTLSGKKQQKLLFHISFLLFSFYKLIFDFNVVSNRFQLRVVGERVVDERMRGTQTRGRNFAFQFFSISKVFLVSPQ